MTTAINPLLLDVSAELTSSRLLLRIPKAGDGKIIFPAIRQSLPDLNPWLPWATDDYSETSGEEWCRRAAAEFLSRQSLQFLIFTRDENQHAGSIGCQNFDWSVRRCEIGYMLVTPATGRGLMTEAVNRIVAMLRDDLRMRRIQIRADERNARSRRVAEQAGFQLEGIMRSDCLDVNGKPRNTCLFSRVWPD